MKTIKTWDIALVGWATFDSEVRLITQGRTDVKMFAPSPGKLVLIERQPAAPGGIPEGFPSKSTAKRIDALTRSQRESARQQETVQ